MTLLESLLTSRTMSHSGGDSSVANGMARRRRDAVPPAAREVPAGRAKVRVEHAVDVGRMVEQRHPPVALAARRGVTAGEASRRRACRGRRTSRRASSASRRSRPPPSFGGAPSATARQRGLDRRDGRSSVTAPGAKPNLHGLEIDEQRIRSDVVGLERLAVERARRRGRRARRTCGRARGRRRCAASPLSRSIAMNACHCSIVILGSPPPLSTRLPCSTPPSSGPSR